MLFKDEKRELVRLKVKPGIAKLAEEVYQELYPFATEANIDDLFEQMVTMSAIDIGLLNEQGGSSRPSKPVPVEGAEDIKNTDTLEVGDLLGA